jgi:hypothetical protein
MITARGRNDGSVQTWPSWLWRQDSITVSTPLDHRVMVVWYRLASSMLPRVP